jgi:hypothetical protein
MENFINKYVMAGEPEGNVHTRLALIKESFNMLNEKTSLVSDIMSIIKTQLLKSKIKSICKKLQKAEEENIYWTYVEPGSTPADKSKAEKMKDSSRKTITVIKNTLDTIIDNADNNKSYLKRFAALKQMESFINAKKKYESDIPEYMKSSLKADIDSFKERTEQFANFEKEMQKQVEKISDTPEVKQGIEKISKINDAKEDLSSKLSEIDDKNSPDAIKIKETINKLEASEKEIVSDIEKSISKKKNVKNESISNFKLFKTIY